MRNHGKPEGPDNEKRKQEKVRRRGSSVVPTPVFGRLPSPEHRNHSCLVVVLTYDLCLKNKQKYDDGRQRLTLIETREASPLFRRGA